MEPVLTDLRAMLTALQSTMRALPTGPGHFASQFGWTVPATTPADYADAVGRAIAIIDNAAPDVPLSAANIDALNEHLSRMQFLRDAVVANLPSAASYPHAVASVFTTIHATTSFLKDVLPSADGKAETQALKKARERIRSLESALAPLTPRIDNLKTQLDRIERADAVADQLPATLAELEDAGARIEALKTASIGDRARIEDFVKAAAESSVRLHAALKEADRVLERTQKAYSAATNVGLAAAFAERSSSLAASVWVWVVLLVVALGAGAVVGHFQFAALSAELRLVGSPGDSGTAHHSGAFLLLRLALVAFSVGAPVWFSWLATKQIGQRFRLAEDYAFKASVARAYEGFRREAERVDPRLEARLLASALMRLDELPGRLVESDTHGSPWHEALSSDVVKDAVRSIPDFPERVRALASDTLTGLRRPTEAKPVVTKPNDDAKKPTSPPST